MKGVRNGIAGVTVGISKTMEQNAAENLESYKGKEVIKNL